jgi:hypothetical protein
MESGSGRVNKVIEGEGMNNETAISCRKEKKKN